MYNFLYQTVLIFSRDIYYSQKELKHFALEILVVYGVLGHFELYQVFMYNFLNNNVLNCFNIF